MDERLQNFKRDFPETAKGMTHVSVEVTKLPVGIPDYVKEALMGARLLATEINPRAYHVTEKTGRKSPVTTETYMIDRKQILKYCEDRGFFKAKEWLAELLKDERHQNLVLHNGEIEIID